MKSLYPLILILVFIESAYSQERIKPERIEFLIENPVKLTKADGWCINNDGEWTKNTNILSKRHESLNKGYPPDYNFEYLYFNKFNYNNITFYCLVFKKIKTLYLYSSIKEDPFLTNEIHFFIFRPEYYQSMIDFVNSKTQGLIFLKPVALGYCSALTSEYISENQVKFKITNKIESYFDFLSTVESKASNTWERDKKTRKLYKSFDNYLQKSIEKSDSYYNQNNQFAINNAIVNGQEVIRFLLPFNNMYYSDEDAFIKNIFTKKYFEVPRSEFMDLIIN